MAPCRKTVFANGEYYHVFNRGVEKRPLFTSKYEFSRAIELIKFYRFEKPPLKYSKFKVLELEKKELFLKNLTKTSVEIVAFCLMDNHFHFLLKQTGDHGISKFIANFCNSYTKYFNTKHQRVGPLVGGAFKAVHVESEEQLIHLSRYIHLNPVVDFRIKLDELEDYIWSSYPDYISSRTRDFVNPNDILVYFKKPDSYKKFVLDQVEYAKTLKNIEHLMIIK